MSNIVLQENVEDRIFAIRGKRVLLDFDLAELYKVPTKRLNEQVKRNINRFPGDFMFQLTASEVELLRRTCSRSQIATLKRGHNIKYFPYAFTEQGVAMLSGVLHSEKAIKVNIAIMRAFVRIKQVISAHKELSIKLDQLERKYAKHDVEIQTIFNVIKKLIMVPEKPKRPIGFLRDREG
ncbi:MAG: ORF6N domain-containing protein [Candidatus Margulisiibacteriota bacterium]